jgi:excisionase family DNA binding protein
MKHNSEQARLMATAIEEPAWISYSEAQRYAGLGRTKIFELVSAGEVDAAKIGRAVRISRESLEKYMKRNSYVQAAR